MHFHSAKYLLSSKNPFAPELRKTLFWACVNGARGHVSRLARGRLGRLSIENREKYDRLAGTYYSESTMEIPKLRVVDGRLCMAPGELIRHQYVDRLAEVFRTNGVQ